MELSTKVLSFFLPEVKLAEGSYHLSADLFATDNSSNNTATVYVGGIARSVTATNQWQTVSIDFEADGNTPITIGAKADHKSNEIICAFDNFVLTKEEPVGIKSRVKGQGTMINGTTSAAAASPTHPSSPASISSTIRRSISPNKNCQPRKAKQLTINPI